MINLTNEILKEYANIIIERGDDVFEMEDMRDMLDMLDYNTKVDILANLKSHKEKGE